MSCIQFRKATRQHIRHSWYFT